MPTSRASMSEVPWMLADVFWIGEVTRVLARETVGPQRGEEDVVKGACIAGEVS